MPNLRDTVSKEHIADSMAPSRCGYRLSPTGAWVWIGTPAQPPRRWRFAPLDPPPNVSYMAASPL
ncbi:hypothetical protein AMC87_PC00424 (plasmid) [Rhizobium phaseoli]|nr:hypothetical protein AMC87_PC00424 [Rhizobium phaseoli]EGE57203.1 hypothetical protein RHECNPAF_467002 [Rhizobium etli CNPAF512]